MSQQEPISMDQTPPFHNLLYFYASRSDFPNFQTVRLIDSLTGNLALGLDFPVALGVAIARHLYLRNTNASILSGFSWLDVYVPSVKTRETWLEGIQPVLPNSRQHYGCLELVDLVVNRQKLGLLAGIDALGLWSLAAGRGEGWGKISAGDVRLFTEGKLFEEIEGRRRVRETGDGNVLPLYRGGPIWVGGHSWVVGRWFGVGVYKDEGGKVE